MPLRIIFEELLQNIADLTYLIGDMTYNLYLAVVEITPQIYDFLTRHLIYVTLLLLGVL